MLNKFILVFFCLFFSLFSYGEDDKIKYRKLNYNDFKKLSINDTSAAVIDLFFDKKDNAIFNQMSLLPLTAILIAIPPTQFVGIGSLALSGPLFLHGGYTLIKYRKKKLHDILTEYKKSKELPNWVRKKTNKILENYEILQINY